MTVDQERQFVEAAAARLRDLPAPPTSGPLVSIVMLNRDGAELLERFLPALAATAYRDVELIVIDNASTDTSLAVLAAFQPGFEVRVIRNDENATFSDANNQGLATARGELVLFLNNDIEPLDPAGSGGWSTARAARTSRPSGLDSSIRGGRRSPSPVRSTPT